MIEIGMMVLEKKIPKIVSSTEEDLALYSEKKAPNFSSLYQRIICSKFD
jgi:hypothetical protein